MPDARYIMIGGFLGAGKTTAILRIAEHFSGEGLRVGLITNDQSVGLVDTALLSAHGFPVEEITGGCFCCRFNSLVAAADRLTANAAPDIFIAEPVGSCTDLKATVDYPLRRMYGERYTVAPFSVLVDPVRARRILGLAPGGNFSEKVLYVYRKQLEEADVIVINKTDLLAPGEIDGLESALRAEYPRAEVQRTCARTGAGISRWIDRIGAAPAQTVRSMDVDYQVYAEGEALLGWLNCTVEIFAEDAFDGNSLLLSLALDLQERLKVERAEIAHLKMTLTPDEGTDIAVVNAVRNDTPAEPSHRLQDTLQAGQLILNLRAEAHPDILRSAVVDALGAAVAATAIRTRIEHMEHFQPAPPTPTHRLAAV